MCYVALSPVEEYFSPAPVGYATPASVVSTLCLLEKPHRSSRKGVLHRSGTQHQHSLVGLSTCWNRRGSSLGSEQLCGEIILWSTLHQRLECAQHQHSVGEYVAPAPVVYAAPASVLENIAPAPSVSCVASAPVGEYSCTCTYR